MWKKLKKSQAWRRFLKNKRANFALLFLLLEVIVCFVVPTVANLNPFVSDTSVPFQSAPSAAHWLGTDSLGRDLFARLLYGGRVSLTVGISAAVISVLIGVPLGLIAGYFRGIPEMIIMRLADIFMAFPSMTPDFGAGGGSRSVAYHPDPGDRDYGMDRRRQTDLWKRFVHPPERVYRGV